MEITPQPKSFAWQPLTLGGVSAFARAPLFCLLLWQLLVAILAIVSLLWFLHRAWEPALLESISQLPMHPDESRIESGILVWTGTNPLRLGGGSFVSLGIDLHRSGELGQMGDLQLELGNDRLRLLSLFGVFEVGYPLSWRIPLQRSVLDPWWGAWKPAVFAAIGSLTFFLLFVVWIVLATLYVVPVRLVAFFADREVSWSGSWKLGGAALLPGALLIISSLVAYGLQHISLIQFFAAGVLHLVVGWFFLIGGSLRLPRLAFPSSPIAETPSEQPQTPRLPGKNPFVKS